MSQLPRAPQAPGFGRLLAVVVGFVALGVPLVALAWHNLNHLLSGDVRLGPLLVFVGAGGGLAAVMVGLGQVISRWEVPPHGRKHG